MRRRAMAVLGMPQVAASRSTAAHSSGVQRTDRWGPMGGRPSLFGKGLTPSVSHVIAQASTCVTGVITQHPEPHATPGSAAPPQSHPDQPAPPPCQPQTSPADSTQATSPADPESATPYPSPSKSPPRASFHTAKSSRSRRSLSMARMSTAASFGTRARARVTALCAPPLFA